MNESFERISNPNIGFSTDFTTRRSLLIANEWRVEKNEKNWLSKCGRVAIEPFEEKKIAAARLTVEEKRDGLVRKKKFYEDFVFF